MIGGMLRAGAGAPTCKGSYALGSQCGRCPGCIEERTFHGIPADWKGAWPRPAPAVVPIEVRRDEAGEYRAEAARLRRQAATLEDLAQMHDTQKRL